MHYREVYNSTAVNEKTVHCIRQMPKVEIHVHLEGATSPQAVFKMAQRNQVTLPAATLEDWQAFYEFRDFNHFIEVYLASVACMQTSQDFIEMVVDFMAGQARQNIRYSEVFFSAALHYNKLPIPEMLAALEEGVRRGREAYGVDIAFIPDLSRDTCQEETLQQYVLDIATRAQAMGIGVGMGIGGKEIGFPPEQYGRVFAEARSRGLHVVAHGGETSGPGSVRGAVDVLQAERIGHGIDVLGDPALVEALRLKKVPFEVSPQSNYCTRVVERAEPHPLRRMVDSGLLCTVNSDDPAMFSTDLNNEYLTLAAQGFTFPELWQLNLNGLEASFLGEERKQALRGAWLAWRSAHPPK